MDETTEWLAENAIKVCIAILALGIIIGIGGNKLIGIFISSQTDAQFLTVNDKFNSLDDRMARDEQTIDAISKATQAMPGQIADVKIQQATISSQLTDVITELGRLQSQFDKSFSPTDTHRNRATDHRDLAQE